MTYDVKIMIKTFFMSSCTYLENFVSIRQAFVEKNTKVLCDKQTKTDRQTNIQTNGPKHNTLSFGKGNKDASPEKTEPQTAPLKWAVYILHLNKFLKYWRKVKYE